MTVPYREAKKLVKNGWLVTGATDSTVRMMLPGRVKGSIEFPMRNEGMVKLMAYATKKKAIAEER